MKLVIAIISNSDLDRVLGQTSAVGFPSTRIATKGQFLQDGHTTMLFSVTDDKVNELFDVIKKNVTKRVIRNAGVESTIEGSLLNKPVDVETGGAVALVINVEDFKKL